MFFRIAHTTEYVYSEPATESFSEIRLRPRELPSQKILRQETVVEPNVSMESYTDYFGNLVETVSIPFRHTKLSVTSKCDVQTSARSDFLEGLSLTISEARGLYYRWARELHDFLRPSACIPVTAALKKLAAERLAPDGDFASSIKQLNHYIFKSFAYRPGATDVGTNVSEFLKKREGVCQDFTHLFISLLRATGIPARYVSGYIESNPSAGEAPPEPETHLIGAEASHAWVEVFAPNGFWFGMDPTNDIPEGERHVQIGTGRDYQDVPPLKGVFKGPRKQSLSVQVHMIRNPNWSDSEPADSRQRKPQPGKVSTSHAS